MQLRHIIQSHALPDARGEVVTRLEALEALALAVSMGNTEHEDLERMADSLPAEEPPKPDRFRLICESLVEVFGEDEYEPIPCGKCPAPSTRIMSFLYDDYRRNPASSAYGKDDCSWCSDHDAFGCEEHWREVMREPPAGMGNVSYSEDISNSGRWGYRIKRKIDHSAYIRVLVDRARTALTVAPVDPNPADRASPRSLEN